MADVIALATSFPPADASKLSAKDYDRQLSAHKKELDKIPQATWTKSIDKSNPLDLLDPAVNTLPYLEALLAQASTAGKDRSRTEDLLDRAYHFVTVFDRVQIRYAGERWPYFMRWLFDALEKTSSKNFSPISTAMLHLDPTGGTFTTYHHRFVRLCLESGVPSQTLPILDKDIYAFPQVPVKNVPEELLSSDLELSNAFITPKSGFTQPVKPEHVLEYYLLGASVYIGRRDFVRARLFLESVILYPTQQHGCSAFHVEAYRKWALIGLLQQGHSFPLPRTHDAATMKTIRSIARPYDALVECFERRDWRKFQAEMDQGTQIWHEDGNLRLVSEAGDALIRYRISDLQKTFAAVTIGTVASHIGFQPAATLRMVSDMVQQGSLNASISDAPSGETADSVLRFDLGASSTSSKTLEDDDLEAQTKRIEDLVTYIRDADRRLQLTKEYVEYARRTKRSGGPDADLADQMDLTWDAPPPSGEDGDEDIMAA